MSVKNFYCVKQPLKIQNYKNSISFNWKLNIKEKCSQIEQKLFYIQGGSETGIIDDWWIFYHILLLFPLNPNKAQIFAIGWSSVAAILTIRICNNIINYIYYKCKIKIKNYNRSKPEILRLMWDIIVFRLVAYFLNMICLNILLLLQNCINYANSPFK